MTTAVFLDRATVGPHISTAPLAALVSRYEEFTETDTVDVVERCRDVEIVVTNKVRFGVAEFEQLPALRCIGLTATGTDNVDLTAARAAGVAVANIEGYCTASVVQHVFGVILQLTHHIARYAHDVQRGAWGNSGQICLHDYPIRELAGRTLGIIGYGALGQGVANAANAFGLKVIVARRDDQDERPGRLPLPVLLAQADIVSLHCPLTPATHHLIDADALAAMRPDALLINTARGGLIDTEALATALQAGQLGGAGIDVLETEPPTASDPLATLALPNLIVTPHIAWAAKEARQRAIDETAANIAAFLAGTARNRVDLD
ncbi:MAG: D-2-hydroxyacid dehydrogenase [Pseudomonadota bacterium]